MNRASPIAWSILAIGCVGTLFLWEDGGIRSLDANGRSEWEHLYNLGLGPCTRAELLETWWGDRWPLVREEIVQDHPGYDLESRLAPGSLFPWHELEVDLSDALVGSGAPLGEFVETFADWTLRDSARWTTSEFVNPEGKQLDEIHLLDLEAIAASYDPFILETSERVSHQVLLALDDAVRRRAFWRAPLVSAGRPGRFVPRGSWSQSTVLSLGGWRIQVDLDSADHQKLEDAVVLLRSLKREAALALKVFVEGV